MSNWAFVAVSFGLTWAVVIAYTLFVVARDRRARAALAATYATAEPSPRAYAEPAREMVTLTAVEVTR